MEPETIFNVLLREGHVEEKPGWDFSWESAAMSWGELSWWGDMEWWPTAVGILAWAEVFS